jgi:uncharacterized protein
MEKKFHNMNCFHCTKPKSTLRCMRCKEALYCSAACQKAHWKKKHKQTCLCPICHTTNSSIASTVLECGHVFHVDCASGLKQFNTVCPLCEVDAFTECYLTMKSDKPDFKTMESIAETGDVRAQFYLAVLYRSVKDAANTFKWCLKAGENGHAVAQLELAYMFYNGEGVKRDAVEALRWTLKSADQGINEAKKNAGDHFYYGDGCDKDEALAARYFEESSKAIPDSAYNFGILLLNGKGVEKNERKALEMFYRAGDHEMAQFSIGVMLYQGKGVPRNETLSTMAFQKASDKGNAEAQYNLGCAYREGRGVAVNLELAAMWNTLSAAKGCADAQFRCGLDFLLGEGVEKNVEKASEWFAKAAEKGCADAQYCLARVLLEKQDPQCMVWFRKAAEQGNESALEALECVNDYFAE